MIACLKFIKCCNRSYGTKMADLKIPDFLIRTCPVHIIIWSIVYDPSARIKKKPYSTSLDKHTLLELTIMLSDLTPRKIINH